MNKWEYLTLETSTNYGSTKFHVNGELQTALKNAQLPVVMNQLGSQGWELVGLNRNEEGNMTYVCKRPRVPTGQLK